MKVIKLLKVVGIVLLILILALAGLLFYFSKNIKPILVSEINKSLNVQVDVDEIVVSEITDFPNLGIVFKDVTINESTPYYKNHLLKAQELALYINIKELWKGIYEVDEIRLKNGVVRLADLKNSTNYDVVKTDTSSNNTSAVSFEIKKLVLDKSQVFYIHTPSKLKINTTTPYAKVGIRTAEDKTTITVKGKLLQSDLTYDKEEYLTEDNLLINTLLTVNNSVENVVIDQTDLEVNGVKLTTKGTVNFSDDPWLEIFFNSDNTTCQSLLGILPKSISSSVEHLKIGGDVNITGKMAGKTSGKNNPSLDLTYALANTSISGSNAKMGIEGINGNGELTIPNIGNLNSAKATIQINKAKQGDNSVNGFLSVVNFNRPQIKWKGKATLSVPSIVDLTNTKDISKSSGNINVNGELALTLNTSNNTVVPGTMNFEGKVIGKSIACTFTNPEIDLTNLDIELAANNQNLVVKEANFTYNKTSGSLKAYVKSFDEMGSKDSKATLVGDLKIDNFNINDFYTNEITDTSATGSESDDLVPFRMQLKSTFTNFQYNDFKAAKITGNLSSDKKIVLMKDCNISALEGETKANIKLKRSGENFLLDIDSKLADINIKQMFEQFNNFEQTEITDKHLSGLLSGTITTKVLLDQDYEPILSKLYAKANVTITDGALVGYEPLNELSSFVDVKDLQNVKFKTLSNEIEIFDETIHIPRMAIKNNALNLEIEGTHSFENYMEYKMSLKVAELLAKKVNWIAKRKERRIEQDDAGGLTAYLTMTGTPDDLKIKFDRAAMTSNVKEEVKEEKKKFKKALKGEGTLKDDDPKKDYKDDVWDE